MSHSSTSLYNLRSKYFIKTHSQVSRGWLYQRPRWSIAYTNLEQSELQRNAVLSIKTTDIVKEFIILYILFKLNLGITIQNIWSMKPLSWYIFLQTFIIFIIIIYLSSNNVKPLLGTWTSSSSFPSIASLDKEYTRTLMNMHLYIKRTPCYCLKDIRCWS